METKNGDLVLLKDDSMTGIKYRINEYGILHALNVKKPVSVGIVSEYNGVIVIIEFGSRVTIRRFDEIQKRIITILRNRKYATQFSAFDLIDRAMGLFGSKETVKAIRKASKTNFPAVCIYILTSPEVVYPSAFAEFDFKLSDVTADLFGFKEVKYGD